MVEAHETHDKLEECQVFEHASILRVAGQPILIIQATQSYIPVDEFQELFMRAGDFIGQYGVTKFIFDKRKLEVFHQPSMEWYFLDWKQKMYEDHGLSVHRKILPTDRIFQQSVKIGRAKIDRENPDKAYHKMDIQYADTLQAAITA